ncbi:MAG: ribonucleoside triphosphate reductase [Dehalococcoidales bacterium]|nr:ribonucleoside triphosphate reductase [Dehalococcoidales bacterium]
MLLSRVGQIRKRDGRIVLFEPEKITRAVLKAFQSVGDNDQEKAERITRQVSDILEITCRGLRVPDVEEVQDLVEKMLMESGYPEAAKSYILYREQHARLRKTRDLLADASAIIDQYIGQGDWRVKENSNMSYSLQGLNNYISSDIVANYWLNNIYPAEMREAHTAGDLHLHDLGILGAYCCGWDLRDLLIQGFRGAQGKTESAPARHFRSALGQVVNYFYTLQGEAAGAQAFSNFDTLLAPYIRYDKLSFDETRQAMQEFIFNLNVPTRVGFQTPFTNLSFDLVPPSYLKDEAVIAGGEAKNEVYGDFQEEIDMLNRAFAAVMAQGDARGRIFTFPIPTYNITRDFDPDKHHLDDLWEMTAKYGIPYFANYVNTEMRPEDARSMCCRLRLDVREVKRRGGGLFGASPLTGSIGVVTINISRLAYLAGNEETFFSRLDRLMGLAKDSLEIKRKTLERLTNEGLFPYSQFYLQGVYQRYKKYWENHFSTIGLIGMNEACVNMIGEDISRPKGIDLSMRVLEHMKERLGEFQEESGHLYNLEATPGEGASYRLARLDRQKFEKMAVAGDKEPYYTNSTQLPVDFRGDLFEALTLQNELQQQYTGGTVFHCFLGERIDNPRTARDLVLKVARRFGLPYFTLTPTFSICPEHGYIRGEVKQCQVCGAESEIYSRVVGYFRPVSQWNEGKVEEFKDRKVFSPELRTGEVTGNADRRNKGNITDRLPRQSGDGALHQPMQLALPILS